MTFKLRQEIYHSGLPSKVRLMGPPRAHASDTDGLGGIHCDPGRLPPPAPPPLVLMTILLGQATCYKGLIFRRKFCFRKGHPQLTATVEKGDVNSPVPWRK